MLLKKLKEFCKNIYEGFLKLVSSINIDMICQVLAIAATGASFMFPNLPHIQGVCSVTANLLPYIGMISMFVWNWFQNREDKPKIEDSKNH